MNDPAPRSNWAGRVALAPRVALDEVVLAVIRNRQSKTPPELAARQCETEMETASTLFAEQGWLVNPAAYHRQPPLLRDMDLTRLRTRSWPQGYETVTFSSGFRPRGIEPGAKGRARTKHNDTVLVRLLRHRKPAPWVVCLHGFGMGASRFDLTVLWATTLHRKRGFNVAVPVLPLHGPRRSPDDGQLLSLDLVATLHGISQAVWDVRRLVSWIRETSRMPVGVYGLSLGGYLSALLAGIRAARRCGRGYSVCRRAPVDGAPWSAPSYLETLRAEATRKVFSVVSPLAMTPLLPPDRCAILAARGDRLIPGDQPVALRHGWRCCDIHWHKGGHVGFVWSRQARRFVGDRLQSALCEPLQA